jgi:glutathione S-transferase
LSAAGVALRHEPAPGTGELFPHLYGALPLEAVLLTQPFTA